MPALVIDTSGKTAHDYRNLFALLDSVGFKPTYQDFFSFLNQPKIERYETIFFILDGRAAINMNNSHVQKCLQSIKNFSDAGNKNIALLLPGDAQLPQFVQGMSLLLNKCGVPTGKKAQPLLASFLRHAFRPDLVDGKLFGTTLINKSGTLTLGPRLDTMINNKTQQIVATPLPRQTRSFTQAVQATFPLALFIKNERLNNNYLIMKASRCTFSEFVENFFSNPLNFDTRNERLSALQQTFHEFYTTIRQGTVPRTMKYKKLQLPHVLTKQFVIAQKKKSLKKLKASTRIHPAHHWLTQRPLSLAWLEPGDYFLNDRNPSAELPVHKQIELKQKAMQRGMDFMYDAGFNLLWFEFNPELFLAHNGLQKNKKTKFVQQVRAIGAALQERFARGNKPFPKVFIGTDITTNYRTNPVHVAAKDFYGQTYSKIPSPLDFTHFWKPELLAVFDAFVDEFEKYIPIDGIFLDFEMYHAQKQSADFSNVMGFSDLAWKAYVDATGQRNLLQYVSVDSRVNHLIKTNKLNHYRNTLTQKAQQLGTKIKNHLHKKKPHLLIGVYAPTPASSWFYRGLLAGLSSKTQPIILATFNTDYYSHAPWLEQQGIYALHGTAIMMSKLTTVTDFNVISRQQELQTFAWFNRPSRMIYKPAQRKNIWWSSEASPLSAQLTAKEIQKQTKTNKSPHKKRATVRY